MSTEKGYTRINELVASLNAALQDMEQGRLGAQGLERITEDARELYERLVVLRHKVREARAALAARSAEERPAAVVPRPEAPPVEPAKAGPAAQPSIRLDTRPDISPRQTSLIDAIAEHEEVPALKPKAQEPEKPKGQEQAQAQGKPTEPEKPKGQEQAQVQAKPTEPEKPKVQEQAQAQAKPAEQEKPKVQEQVQAQAAPASAPAPAPTKGPSLAEKLEHAPIADIGKAITLSQKFLFLAELFGGRTEDYNKAIDTINGHKAFEEAKRYLDGEVLVHLKKAPDPEALASFLDLMERRFK